MKHLFIGLMIFAVPVVVYLLIKVFKRDHYIDMDENMFVDDASKVEYFKVVVNDLIYYYTKDSFETLELMNAFNVNSPRFSTRRLTEYATFVINPSTNTFIKCRDSLENLLDSHCLDVK